MIYLACIYIPIFVTALAISRGSIRSLSQVAQQKHATLDPLRGLAATAVMGHHSLLMYNLMNGGEWLTLSGTVQMGPTLKRLFDSLGDVPVSVFFMITSFLFFDRLIQKQGKIDFKEFYAKRALRILPMYIFMVISVMITFFIFGINGGVKDIVTTLISWLSFSFLPVKSLSDDLVGGRAAAGVIWTLAIEWKFYLLIPFIATFTTTLRTSAYLVIASSISVASFFYLGLMDERDSVIALCFFTGMASALIFNLKSDLANKILKHWISSIICIITLLLSIFFTTGEYTYFLWASISIFFICVSNGNTLLGILKLEPLRFLGLISYSIYLMHGVIFALAFGKIINGVNYFSSIVISGPIIITICTLTYIFIEKRFSSNIILKQNKPYA